LTTCLNTKLRCLVVLLVCFQFSLIAATLYVDVNSSSPIPPYTNWSHAANVLQDAIDASNRGDMVLVTNGVYEVGGRRLGSFDVTNRVVLTNGAVVRSVNGPAVTAIRGYQVPVGVNITNAIRCAYLSSTSVLSGFTLTNGSAGGGNYVNGGGAFCMRLTGCVISNCVFAGNFAAGAGGGLVDGLAIGCIFAGNFGQGGGAADNSALVNCIITNNTAGWAGGTLSCTATNCLFAFNRATNYGGGSAFSTLINCTVVSNSLQAGLGGTGGGSYSDTVYNSVFFGNSAPSGPNHLSSKFAYSCISPSPAGVGNFANVPVFVNPGAGDFRCRLDSPCINAGRNSYVTGSADLDGNPRIVAGTVDVGAYEFQNPVSQIAYYWLQNYGITINSSTDAADPDGDGASNLHEWGAHTVPTDGNSVFKVAAPTLDATGATLAWQSVSGISYYLQRSTGILIPSFSSIQSNIVGQAGTTTFKDTNALGQAAALYRVGVQ
jgi:hypothetical protein